MKKLAVVLTFVVFALGSSALSCTSGRPWMQMLPQEDRDAYLLSLQAAQQATQKAEAPAEEEQVPPPPPPPLFVQADPLTPPEVRTFYTEASYPEQAPPLELETTVVIS